MKRISSLIILMLVSLSIFAQDRPYRKFATQAMHKRLSTESPNFKIEQFQIRRKVNQAKKRIGQINGRVIPVYFHVFYHDAVERISYDQILNQLQELNKDFGFSLQSDTVEIQKPHQTDNNRVTQKYKIGVSSVERIPLDIEFCLAMDLGSSQTPGVNYVQTKQTSWLLDDAIKMKNKGGSEPETPDNILNIWIGKLDNGISGYAQMPGGPKSTDGIVIDYRYFGMGEQTTAPYDLGKTLTHLTGNYLGLLDLWDETNPCGDDFIEDTPVHNSPNFGCPRYMHISTCLGYEPEMTSNFMDNTDDACMKMFTIGQIEHMIKMLSDEGPRNKLLSQSSECSTKNLTKLPTLAYSEKRNEEEIALTIHPNPADLKVEINLLNLPKGRYELFIYSALGKLVFQKTLLSSGGNQRLLVHTEHWPAGIYTVQTQLNGKSLAKQLSIQSKH